MSRYLKIDGQLLHQQFSAWFPQKYTILHGTPPRQQNARESSRRHGSGFSGGKWRTSTACVVLMSVTSTDSASGVRGDYATLARNEAAVKALFLRSERPVLLAEHYSEATPTLGRQALFEVTDEVDYATNGRNYSELRFRLDLVDAFWRDLVEQTVTAATLSTLRGGSAPIPDPVILIPGSGAASYRVTDQVTGQWIEWRGTVAAGQWVRLDPLRETGWLVSSEAWTGGSEQPGRVRTGQGGFEVHPDVQLTMPAGSKVRARRAFL